MILGKLDGIMTTENIGKAALAFKSGLSVETIENARRGKSVSQTTWALIAKALKMKKEDLVIAKEDAL